MDLTIDRLTKQFGSKIAVDRVSTRLTPGVYGLLGANGAGKTTLMRIVCDVLRPTSGEIRFDGRDVRLLGDEYRARLGYLPQDFGYYPDFSALDFMCYLAALKGLDRRAARRRSLELLETVGLADVARQKVRTFSGGMKQRLGIAQAVLNDPAVLVLDEPTAGLDPKERVRFRNLIASFAQDKIVILSTHIVSDVEYIADEILVMRAGAFIMQGAPTDIVATVTGKVWECHVDARRADELAAARGRSIPRWKMCTCTCSATRWFRCPDGQRNVPTLRSVDALDLASFSLALTCEARSAAKRGDLEHLDASR